MTSSEARARARARAAYERAMLVRALFGVWPVAVLVPLALVLHGVRTSPMEMIAVGAALALALVVAGWRGGGWRRGAVNGLVAGLPLFLVPSVFAPADTCGHACAHGPPTSCVIACTVIGVVAGAALAALARRDPDRVARVLTGLVVAGLVGSLTCTLAGGAAVLGAAAGLAAGTAPVVLVRRS